MNTLTKIMIFLPFLYFAGAVANTVEIYSDPWDCGAAAEGETVVDEPIDEPVPLSKLDEALNKGEIGSEQVPKHIKNELKNKEFNLIEVYRIIANPSLDPKDAATIIVNVLSAERFTAQFGQSLNKFFTDMATKHESMHWWRVFLILFDIGNRSTKLSDFSLALRYHVFFKLSPDVANNFKDDKKITETISHSRNIRTIEIDKRTVLQDKRFFLDGSKSQTGIENIIIFLTNYFQALEIYSSETPPSKTSSLVFEYIVRTYLPVLADNFKRDAMNIKLRMILNALKFFPHEKAIIESFNLNFETLFSFSKKNSSINSSEALRKEFSALKNEEVNAKEIRDKALRLLDFSLASSEALYLGPFRDRSRTITDSNLATLYSRIDEFSRIIYSDFPQIRGALNKVPLIDGTTPRSIIYNQQCYDKDVSYPIGDDLVRGPAVRLIDESRRKVAPIGYNIFLPRAPVRGVLVSIYGGHLASGRVKEISMPIAYQKISSLLAKGFAVITLNLADLVELKEFQAEMPVELHNKLHASVDGFLTFLRKNPEDLHKDLTVLKGKKIFLMGDSFGGTMTVRHAQMYPYTFDGYISFNGGLSNQYRVLDRGASKNTPLAPHINPDIPEEINKIVDPILVISAYEDNRVPILNSTAFLQSAKKIGKIDKMFFLFLWLGSPPPDGDHTAKGHGWPENKIIRNKLLERIDFFTQSRMSDGKITALWQKLSQLEQKKASLLATKNYYISEDSKLEDLFLSEAFHLHQKLAYEKKELSDEVLSSLYDSLYFFVHGQKKHADLMAEMTELTIQNTLMQHLKQFGHYIKHTYPDRDLTVSPSAVQRWSKRKDFHDGFRQQFLQNDFLILEYVKINPGSPTIKKFLETIKDFKEQRNKEMFEVRRIISAYIAEEMELRKALNEARNAIKKVD